MSGNYERMKELVHAGIRRDLTRLEQVIREPLLVQRRQALATRVGWLVGFLRHHHASEEEAIWPLAVRKQAQLVELVSAMEEEHQALATAADELRSAAATFAFDGSQSQRQALADALRRMQGACLPHLEHEETVAVPQLMETLDEREWALVDKRFRRGVSPKQLGWIAMWLLDDLAPDDLAFLRSQLPRPVFCSSPGAGAAPTTGRHHWPGVTTRVCACNSVVSRPMRVPAQVPEPRQSWRRGASRDRAPERVPSTPPQSFRFSPSTPGSSCSVTKAGGPLRRRE